MLVNHPARRAGLHSGRFWAIAALCALLALSVTLGSARPAHAAKRLAKGAVGNCNAGADWGTLNASFAQDVLALVNEHRASLGRSQLVLSPTLTAAANWKSLHMSFYRYMTHDDPAPPVARTTGERLAACGYPAGTVGWGENIAYGYATPQAVMTGWLNSSGHRANIENASFRAIGIGVARNSAGTYYWTQAFGTLADGGGTSPPPAAAPTVALGSTPPAATSSNNASFGWTTTGAPTATTCSLDGATAVACTSPWPYSGLSVGSHLRRARVQRRRLGQRLL